MAKESKKENKKHNKKGEKIMENNSYDYSDFYETNQEIIKKLTGEEKKKAYIPENIKTQKELSEFIDKLNLCDLCVKTICIDFDGPKMKYLLKMGLIDESFFDSVNYAKRLLKED